jgi:addiction module HigA family antidote
MIVSKLLMRNEFFLLTTLRSDNRMSSRSRQKLRKHLSVRSSDVDEAEAGKRRCNHRRSVTAPTALILARVFGNSPEFWLNVQRRSELWEAMHSPRERERIKRARPLQTVA